MLPAENRLSKVRDFNLVMEHGRWVNGNFLDIKVLDLAKSSSYVPAREDTASFAKQLKIAFSIGLKVSKKAVDRNRARRQLREVVRLLKKDHKIAAGYYILFVARPKIIGKKYAEISEEVHLLLSRAKVLI